MTEAVNYMASFSELMRRILENSEKLHVSIDEEVKMLKLYVKLENLRFNNEIICDFIIDNSLKNELIEIPSMIIQPFVENAFLHGLAPKKEGERRIEIRIENQKDEIFCSVVDTGIGRKASRLTGEKIAFKHHSLGLEITKKRLKLLDYGKDNPYPFKITDCYDKLGNPIGTGVEIRLKKRK